MLSGDMADIFGNLYLALSVEYYNKNNNLSDTYLAYYVNNDY